MFAASLKTGTTTEYSSGSALVDMAAQGARRTRARRGKRRSHPPVFDFRADPGNDFVEHLAQRGARLVPEDALGLAYVRDATLHVVRVRRIGRVLERLGRAVDLLPDRLRQVEDIGRHRCG